MRAEEILPNLPGSLWNPSLDAQGGPGQQGFHAQLQSSVHREARFPSGIRTGTHRLVPDYLQWGVPLRASAQYLRRCGHGLCP